MGMEEKNHTCAGFFSWMFFCILLSTTTSSVPSSIHCEILEHANITCYWSAVSLDHTNYTLSVNKTNCGTNSMIVGSCTTTNTQCSVTIGSLSHCFCVDVMAQSCSKSTRSPPHCFNGIDAVKLYPPEIISLATVPGKTQCLRLKWIDHMSENVPSESNFRNIQIEYSTSYQSQSWKMNASLHDWQKDLCGLHPGTKYSVRVRAQDTRAAQHWSSWSTITQATTPEAAPTAAPEMWRHIQPVGTNAQRLITLLWKPLLWPDTNGVILHYTALCWNNLDSGHWDCGDIDSSSTSCVFSVSAQPCTCNLSASNCAGTSPAASMYIPREQDTVLPAPESISITPLDDFQLNVVWKVAIDLSEASFVVEWFLIPNNTACALHWKILNGSTRNFIITDGLQPEVPYNVSVRVFHNNAVGAARFATAFTRQGVPSVGPTLEVLQTASDCVTLKWRALPLEILRGFIQNYIVLYQISGKMKSQVLGRNVEQFSLTDLSPGEYSFCVTANTVAGDAAGPWVTVVVWSDNIPVMAIVLCAVGFLLIVVILLSQAVRIQQSLCPAIPDPSKSNLSSWPSISSRQLPVLDFKPSPPPLLKPIFVGRLPGTCDYHHHEESQVWAFSKYINFYTPVMANTDKRTSEPTFSKLDDEEMTEDLTTDFSHQNSIMTKLQSSIQPDSSSSFSAVPDSYLDIDMVDTGLCERNFEICQETNTFSSPPLSTSCGRVDTLDNDHLHKKNIMSRLKSCCYTHVSTSCLPVTESYHDLCTLNQNFCNPLPKSSLSETHLSSSYHPVSEPSLECDGYITVDAADFLHQSMSKTGACGYIHLSTSYLPVPLSNSDSALKETDSSTFLYKNSLKSCCFNYAQTLDSHSSLDFEIDDVYRTLEPDECPLQKHNTEDSADLLRS
ncbi:interleukin-31 receptor subunit alpha [Trichomycterus rosablanca]|uniref:interleukin-31 receptor subunit alpha n=1 Tax=Trichomycterus rosablanca TaxID=2290929 RepID=UPI002F34F6BE